jgi:hypothetical protein
MARRKNGHLNNCLINKWAAFVPEANSTATSACVALEQGFIQAICR